MGGRFAGTCEMGGRMDVVGVGNEKCQGINKSNML